MVQSLLMNSVVKIAGKRLAYASKNNIVRVVDMKAGAVLAFATAVPLEGVAAGESSSYSIYCMDIHKDGNIVMCGCDSGALFSLNADNAKVRPSAVT